MPTKADGVGSRPHRPRRNGATLSVAAPVREEGGLWMTEEELAEAAAAAVSATYPAEFEELETQRLELSQHAVQGCLIGH